MRGSLYKIRPRVAACIKKDHAWQLQKQPRVETSEVATHGTPLAVCHAANLAWATVHYCVANAFVMCGTTQKMPRVCEVISGLYCTCMHIMYLLPTESQPLQPLEAPSNFRVSMASSTTIKFSWDALDIEQPGQMFNTYVITCSESNNFTVSVCVLRVICSAKKIT